MRREGRQHGMVRTFESQGDSPWKPISNSKFTNRLETSLPTAGTFSKVTTKPTNHSKYTSRCRRPRCRGCHVHPCDKAKDKTKGSNKIRRSRDEDDDDRVLVSGRDDDYYYMDNDDKSDEVYGCDAIEITVGSWIMVDL